MAEYFSHDYHARHDAKLMHVQRVMGMEGIGIFWCLVEYCYEQGGTILKSECESIAFDMRTDSERIATILQNFGLFDFDGEKYTSNSITERIEHRKKISEKASISAKIRHNHANAVRTLCEGSALKEIKVKESKDKDSTSFSDFWRAYPKKVGKGDAEKAWKKITAPVETLALILTALSWQTKSEQWTRDNGQYIPNPSTYLNQTRWLDEPQKPIVKKNVNSTGLGF